MSTIVTRTSKGSPLSWAEADANLTNLNTDKLEASALTPYLTSATAASTYETQTHASSTYETQTHASSTYPTKANNLSDLTSASTARTNLGLGTSATLASTAFASSGAVTGNGNTMSTGKLLGRSTASTGSIEEITVGTGLSLTGGTLSGGGTLMTEQSCSSGTTKTFTGIPTTAKRITVLFNNVSVNGVNPLLVQIGSGSLTTTGYNSTAIQMLTTGANGGFISTTGFIIGNDTATDYRSGSLKIHLLGSNIYVCDYTLGSTGVRSTVFWGGGNVTLSNALDRVAISATSGDSFDNGSINVIYE